MPLQCGSIGHHASRMKRPVKLSLTKLLPKAKIRVRFMHLM